MIIARKVMERRAPVLATEREVAAIRGRTTTEAEVQQAAQHIEVGHTFYERYYTLKG